MATQLVQAYKTPKGDADIRNVAKGISVGLALSAALWIPLVGSLWLL
jgi:hypothetical protein